MNTYSFYVGSTATHDAHAVHGNVVPDAFPYALGNVPRVLTFGVREGETEATAIYSAELADDATAQRVAYAMAVLTGNAVVMVVRDTTERDTYQSLNSTMRYRASRRTAYNGNGTLFGDGRGFTRCTDPARYRYESDPTGPEIVFLVGLDATVSPL